jgi:hypothetical protein
MLLVAPPTGRFEKWVAPVISPLLASALTAIVTIYVTNAQRAADIKREQAQADRSDRQRMSEARRRAYSRLNGLKVIYASAADEQWVRALDVSLALARWNLTPTKEIKDHHSKMVDLNSTAADRRAEIGKDVFEVLADVSENFDDVDDLQKAIDAFYEGDGGPFLFARKGDPMPKSDDEVMTFQYANKARIEARVTNSITNPLNRILALMRAQIDAHSSAAPGK